MTTDGIAQQNERGVLATCPITKQPYITSRPMFTTVDGQTAVQCNCRFCEATKHTYLLDQVSYDTQGVTT